MTVTPMERQHAPARLRPSSTPAPWKSSADQRDHVAAEATSRRQPEPGHDSEGTANAIPPEHDRTSDAGRRRGSCRSATGRMRLTRFCADTGDQHSEHSADGRDQQASRRTSTQNRSRRDSHQAQNADDFPALVRADDHQRQQETQCCRRR
mgnify:CR=1 FL=1